MAKRQPVRLELLLDYRTQSAALDPGGEADRVDLEDAVHGREVDGYRAGVIVAQARLDPADHGRPASKGDRGHAGVRAPIEQLDNFAFGGRPGDDIGRVVDLTQQVA